MPGISTLDWVVVAIYLAGTLALGLWLGRGQQSATDYFLGGRNIPAWAILMSIVATETSTVTFLSLPGMSFAPGGDFRFLQLTLGYVVGRFAVVLFLLPHYFRGEIFTIYELLGKRFGSSARKLCSVLFLVTRTLADGMRLFLTALVLKVAFDLDVSICVLIMGTATIIYTFMGGVRSVIWNDCLQLTIYIGGAFLAVYVLLDTIPGGWDETMRFASETKRLRLVDFSTSLVSKQITFWSGLIGGGFLSLASHGADQLMVQRYLSARSQTEAAAAVSLSGFIVLAQFALFLGIGVLLATCNHHFPLGAEKPDEAFITFLVRYMPTGLLGLILSAVFAAAMSTLSSSLNSSATAFVNDFLVTEETASATAENGGDQATRWGRWATIMFGIFQMGVAIGTDRFAVDSSIISKVLAIAGFTSGPILGLFLLGIFSKSARQPEAIAGLVIGITTVSTLWIATSVSWPWYTVVGSLTTLLTGKIIGMFRTTSSVPPTLALILFACLLHLSLPVATAVQAESSLRLPNVPPETVGLDSSHLEHIEPLVLAEIEKGNFPGCVITICRQQAIAYQRAFGHRQQEPTLEPMTVDTIFDMASITKPVSTATSVMQLVEQGKIRLRDPVSKYIPEFANHGKDKITIEQLLTHASGLVPDNPLGDYLNGTEQAWKNIYELTPIKEPGTKFIYSDVNFLLLAHLVERITGKNIDQYTQEHLFAPLQMHDTRYNPPVDWSDRIAPTETLPESERVAGETPWLRGTVHDPRARALGGIAGHAGLFSTANDLAIYAEMMKGQGTYKNRTILSGPMFESMTRPRDVAGNRRGLGWDMRSVYSRNRGELLSQAAFGHGGFTGTAIWIDPELDLTLIFLANRLHPDGKGTVNDLAGRIGTIAAAAIGRQQGSDSTEARPARFNVRTGIDVLQDTDFQAISDQRIGLITNHTGVDRSGTPTWKILHEADNVDLVALFSPEHGFAGELDISHIDSSTQQETGLPIHSLYGKTRRPTGEQLRNVETIVFDIQDIGARFYTYLSTLGLAMEAAAEHDCRVVVLDRPNPIGGLRHAGSLLDDDQRSFVAYHSIPIRHGMTLGELAMLIRAERKLSVDLQVVEVKNWKRSMLWMKLDLPG